MKNHAFRLRMGGIRESPSQHGEHAQFGDDAMRSLHDGGSLFDSRATGKAA
jgi:hypothetical protein